jgi:hypothetical protein
MSGSRLQRALRGSRLHELVGWTADSTLIAACRSLLASVTAAVRGSWLYNWLTAEPDPEVIVIDLRQTRTAGPVIALLDRTIEFLAPHWRHSRLHRGVQWFETIGERLAATRVGQLVVHVLTPPDVPDDTEDNK